MIKSKVLIIAGPNGAGKTTFAREFLPNEASCPIFINADLIAAGLSPFAPELAAIKAGRLMLEMMVELEAQKANFAFETTLSGMAYVKHIKKWQAMGYHVALFFLSIPFVEMAIGRVAERVAQGGHSVPEDVIRRRFVAGRRNFETIYRNLVDSWLLYDNGGDVPILLEWGEKL